ncbi:MULTISPECIES: 3-mercaptopyruvate sulfurtransferase [unclassified Beijerinckia]|uniref:3-mercaptopyruvate sulfurtransferase n=1 Tax=unclassified Beijerinckia TaxID=2638183 RepID=UPI00089A913E|nr:MULTISPECIES: 3-mercaptopyruvate sulfurtransferase [unclassified Beijerinckia]MDH7795756.1 thiosulfate/3-mercaptopyruvate sulfurtransferase [Beijerinckia sp. GAS462]SEC14863.1 thiosulfate/3-mercaptopyruvate sulfurtransferase [Beijerinckia sp. 28-YEA-48]
MNDSASQASAPIVSTAWLADRLGTAGLSIVDASWYLPAANRDGKAEYAAGHIPGAVFFDIDEVSDKSSDLPHMLPDPTGFAQAAAGLGVNTDDDIVVYDGGGLFSAPRVWWMFRLFGARKVHVLDGGLPRWKTEGRPVEQGVAQRHTGAFTATLNKDGVAHMADVAAALQDNSAQVLDVRAAGRFTGETPEPRPGLPSGHMPGARNLPTTELVANGALKSKEELLKAFHDAGINPDEALITSCGSGVSAAIANLALAVAGKPQPKLYDGSWTEWASRGQPVAKGKP